MKINNMDKLKELENESQELLSSIKSMADKENLEMSLPSLEITDSEPKLLHRRIPSWVAVAAMLAGIVIGFAMPKLGNTNNDVKTAFNYADTCRSIAQNDVNLSLLITSF
jgi:type VI protein secretion system component VasF